MTPRFPADLEAWQRWQTRRHVARRLVAAVRGRRDVAPTAWLATAGATPARALVVLESRAASSRLAVLAPVSHLAGVPTAIVAPFDPTTWLPGWTARELASFDPARDLPDVQVVLSAAHYLPLGAAAYAHATERGLAYATVQHGLLTPFVPPLPAQSTLLAWTPQDAAYWTAGRTDVDAVVVGSELFHQAAEPAEHVSRFATPTFLGQLHGAELSRRGMTLAAARFCGEVGAIYRPHPSETDRLSRLTHELFERRGIAIDRSGTPLVALGSPVVSAFSTGVLEAAARGVPAWVYYPDPPRWLVEFWQRYGMRPWGGEPTPAPPTSRTAPASLVAAWVRERA